jgi:hypothetical protein
MKLQNEVKLGIPVREMSDGQIGIIVSWSGFGNYVGRIVQRYGDTLISLQKPSGNSWSQITLEDDCRVRILQKGETLIIE